MNRFKPLSDSSASKTTNRLIRLFLTAGIIFFSTLPACGLAAEDEEKISIIEKKLFFKMYKSEAPPQRLTRIEKKYFGEELSASEEERLKRIFEAAGPISMPATPAPVAQMDTTPTGEPDTSQAPAPQTKKKFDDPDAAWEKVSVAALASRDQEIRGMLKEAIRSWKQKNHESAIQQFNQIIRLDPQNAEALFSLGVVYESQGDFAQALDSYTKAHDINPDNMSYKSAIMTLKEKVGDKKVEDEKQHDVDELAQEAAAAFKRKEYISALELYKRLEQKFPKHAVYKYNIGTLYLLMQNPVQALEYYQMAKKLKPKEQGYIEAVKKLETSIDTDEQKREAADELWDKKEKADAKAAKQAEKDKKNKKGPQQGMSPHAQPPQNPLGMQVSPARDGVLVNGVGGGSRAAKAGLKGGDVIVAVDGITTQNPGQLIGILSRKGPNEKAQLIINRKGKIDQLLF